MGGVFTELGEFRLLLEAFDIKHGQRSADVLGYGSLAIFPDYELGGERDSAVLACKCFFGGSGIARGKTSNLWWNNEPRCQSWCVVSLLPNLPEQASYCSFFGTSGYRLNRISQKMRNKAKIASESHRLDGKFVLHYGCCALQSRQRSTIHTSPV